jgi:hypothetical protein
MIAISRCSLAELRHDAVIGVQRLTRRRDNHHTRPLSVNVALSAAVTFRVCWEGVAKGAHDSHLSVLAR